MGHYEYHIDGDSKEGLLTDLPTKYPHLAEEGVTYQYGDEGHSMPEIRDAAVIAVVDDGKGMQTAIVQINGSVERPDGGIYNLPLSWNPNQKAPKALSKKSENYNVHHCDMLAMQAMNTDGTPKDLLTTGMSIQMLDKVLPFGADTVYVKDDHSVCDVRAHDIGALPSDVIAGSMNHAMNHTSHA